MLPTRAHARLDAPYGFDVCRVIDLELLCRFRSSSIWAGRVCSTSDCASAPMARLAGFGMRQYSTGASLAVTCPTKETFRRTAFCETEPQRHHTHLRFDSWYDTDLGGGHGRDDGTL